MSSRFEGNGTAAQESAGGTDSQASSHRLTALDSDVVESHPVRSNGGKVILTTSNKAYFIAAGASSDDPAARVLAYAGSQAIVSIHSAGDGVVSWFSQGGAYFSANGLNIGGGGPTVRAYNGTQRIVGIYGVNGGVVTLFSGGGAYFSPDGMNLGGGGNSPRAYSGTQRIERIEEVSGSLQTRFSQGGLYASSSGLNLGGGGTTKVLPTSVQTRVGGPFGPRDSARGIKWSGRMLLSSGFHRTTYSYYDLWQSADGGRSWSLAFGSPEPAEDDLLANFYPPYSPLVEHGGRIFAIGDQVWSSVDGVNWSMVSRDGPALAHEDTHAFAVGDEMFFVDTSRALVLSSVDGQAWRERSGMDGFRRRCGAAVTQAQGKIWIAGGAACDYSEFFDDTWTSTDGATWTRIDDPATGLPLRAAWGGRAWPCLVASSSGTLWMFGGFTFVNGVGRNLADLWFSLDGTRWTQARPTGLTIQPRHAPTCYSQIEQGRILVVGGKGSADGINDNAGTLDDVWAIDVPVDSLLR